MSMLWIWAAFAGVVRGYSGFGFAMLLALGLLATHPPAVAIPVTLLLDLICSVSLWQGAARHFHRRIGAWLVVGMLLAIPLGSLLLSRISSNWMALVVGLLCLVGGGLVLLQAPQAEAPKVTDRLALPAGFVAGLAMSLASAGGPPLMLYLLRSGLPAVRLRATAIVFFAVSSGWALLGLWWMGSFGSEHLQLAAALLVPALAGNLAGQWLHRHWHGFPLRNGIGVLLVLMSGWILLTSLARLNA